MSIRFRNPFAGRCLASALIAALCVGPGLPARAQVVEVPLVERGAISGTPQRIGLFYEVNPDCSEDGLPAIHVSQPPAHGRVQALPLIGNTDFRPGTQQYACNLRKLPMLALVYVSDRGFQGSDALVVSIIHPNGMREVLRYVLTVESAGPVATPKRPDTWVHV